MRVNLHIPCIYLWDDSRAKMTSMAGHPTISPDMMKLVKTNIFVGATQLKELRKLSRRSLVPVAALIRKAINELLEREKKKKP